MAHEFTIGQGVLRTDHSELGQRMVVGRITLPDAPNLPNDDLTGQSNERSPSDNAWRDFCKVVGILDVMSVFYEIKNPGKRTVKVRYPRGQREGFFEIKQEDLDAITAALTRYKARATKPPGFGSDRYDAHFARLIWLQWWVEWAFTNCSNPVIQVN